jgi:hypothetical protein
VRRSIALGAILVASLGLALAANPARNRILENYTAEARKDLPGFNGFSAERGKALYFGPHAGGQPEACSTCHTANPAKPGQHYKTGREIAPMAVSANPDRFTDPAEVEKRFARDCKNVLRRPCTAQEKGDFITFLSQP